MINNFRCLEIVEKEEDLLGSNYVFKWSNQHETQKVSSVIPVYTRANMWYEEKTVVAYGPLSSPGRCAYGIWILTV